MGFKCKTKINFHKFLLVELMLHVIQVSRYNIITNHSSFKHWFSFYDLKHCVDGTMQKNVIAKHLVLIVWPIQEGNLTQKEVM